MELYQLTALLTAICMLYTVPTRGVNTTEYFNGTGYNATEYNATDDMECEWISNNWNTDGEQYVGNVSSLEECVDLVQANCSWANIANVHESVVNGSDADCYCQHGSNQTHDGNSSYLNCWFDGVSGGDTDSGCDWVRNNENTEGEQYVGDVTSLHECVQLVQEMCPWATIANVHEDAVHGHNASCWCQHGNDQTHDGSASYLNCWFDGHHSWNTTWNDTESWSISSTFSCGGAVSGNSSFNLYNFTNDADQDVLFTTCGSSAALNDFMLIYATGSLLDATAMANVTSMTSDYCTDGEAYELYVGDMAAGSYLVAFGSNGDDNATTTMAPEHSFVLYAVCGDGMMNSSGNSSGDFSGSSSGDSNGDSSEDDSSETNTADDCQWMRNNWNAAGEQYAGHVSSLEECVELVQDMCEWATIANVHESVANGNYSDCWCQAGVYQYHDGSSHYLGCWFDGHHSGNTTWNDTDSWSISSTFSCGGAVSGNSSWNLYNFTNDADQDVLFTTCGSSASLNDFMLIYGTGSLLDATAMANVTSMTSDYCTDGDAYELYVADMAAGSYLVAFGSNRDDNATTTMAPADSFVLYAVCGDDMINSDDSSETTTADNCEWIRNNYNTGGEQYAGHVSSLEDCVELVEDMCEWATIANVHENAADGYNASCWCQTGNYGAHDSQSEWLNCWLDRSPATTSAPIVCREHDDCPESRPLCYYTGWDWLSGNYGTCESCDECHWCQDGVDNTCGSCGEGYPVREDVEFCDGAMDRKLAPFLFIAPFVFAIVLALDQ